MNRREWWDGVQGCGRKEWVVGRGTGRDSKGEGGVTGYGVKE